MTTEEEREDVDEVDGKKELDEEVDDDEAEIGEEHERVRGGAEGEGETEKEDDDDDDGDASGEEDIFALLWSSIQAF